MPATERLIPLSDLLLGAAYADGHFAAREKEKVAELLTTLLDEAALPSALAAWIDAFDPKSFNLSASCAEFAEDAPVEKRQLLELIAAVHDADEELDLAEDDYLKAVAAELDATDQLDGLALVIEIEKLRTSMNRLRAVPPPPPGAGD
jgi:uncharacterized tellurite resistance protein B-like protein